MSQPRQIEQKGTWWSAALVFGAIAAAMTPAFLLAAGGAGGGFDSVVRGIESRYHAHADKVPFMGLISLVAGHATHGGVRGIHVAEIEHLDEPVDGAELTALVEKRAGEGWQRMIRETGRNGDEQSLIYLRPEGERMGMLIVDLDNHEMDVVEISVNPDQLVKEIADHHHGKHRADVDEDDSKTGDTGKLDKSGNGASE